MVADFTGRSEVRFHSSAPKRNYLTKREAEILLSTVDKQVTIVSNTDGENLGIMKPAGERSRRLWQPEITPLSRP